VNGRIGCALDSPSAGFEDAFEQLEQEHEQQEDEDEEEDDNGLLLPTVRTFEQASTGFV
jgi:ribosomal protein L12E/L44/L45/RPP1/RPP2